MCGVDVLVDASNRDLTRYRKAVNYLASQRLISLDADHMPKQENLATLSLIKKSTLSIQLKEIDGIVSMQTPYGKNYRFMIDKIWEMSQLVANSKHAPVEMQSNGLSYVHYKGTAACMMMISHLCTCNGLSIYAHVEKLEVRSNMQEILRYQASELLIPSKKRLLTAKIDDYIVSDGLDIKVIDKLSFEREFFGR